MGITDIADVATFNKEIDVQNQLVVVDFYATWCGPCKTISPFVEQLSQKYTTVKFIKVDVDRNPDAAQQANVEAMPTFAFYVNGKLVDSFQGADKNGLEQRVKKHLENKTSN